MTIWTPNLQSREGPRYQALAEAIGEAIASGELPAGSRLPAQRDLAWRLGVTVGTVGRAYLLAEQRGLLSGEVGRGTFVRPPLPAAEATLLGSEPEAAHIDLTHNAPAGGGHGPALAATLTALGRHNDLSGLLGYAPSVGHARHRAAGAAWIGRTGHRVAPEQVILTAGAQHGLAMALSVLAEPGERILTESLTYCGLLEAAALYRQKVEGLAMDAEGILPGALEAACDAAPVRVLCIVPTLQNPTVATMSLERRQQIAEIARRRDLLIIEDDVYGYLPPDRPPPIATLAPERTFYVASASKCIAPGLRVAWLAIPPGWVSRFAQAVHATQLALPALSCQIVTQWIEDGTADRLTEAQRVECQARQAIAAEVFAGFTKRADPYCLHVLLDLPPHWRSEDFATAAQARGISVVPVETFAPNPIPLAGAVRISLTAVSGRDQLRQALETLAALAREEQGLRRSVI